MTNTQAIILGIVQGLTEYLPVSSSAHLVLVPHLLGWEFLPKESFIFDVLVQLGTLLGVLIYFYLPIKEVVISVLEGLYRRQPFHNENARLGWMVALSTLPAAVIGLLYKEQLLMYFSSPAASCYSLIATGLILVAAEYANRAVKVVPTRNDAVMIGFAQSVALLPGISRSGATIAAGMALGMPRANAARFSFLMSIPVIMGASLIAALDLFKDIELLEQMSVPLALGFLSAAISGYLVIKWFMSFLSSQKLIWFAIYCVGLGAWGIYYFA